MKTTMRPGELFAVCLTVAALGSWSGAARAQGGSGDSPAVTSPRDHAAAQVHFKKAKELYQTGAYHEAATELEAALALDPSAKELIFNLGVVDERLGRIDEALAQFHKYQTLDLSAAERSRSDSYIRRLDGVKKSLAPTPPPLPPPVVTPPVTPPPVETAPPPSPSHGRIDAATVTTFVIGAAGLVVGTVFGIEAISNHPHDYLTGTGGQTYATYQSASDSYHRDATISTVGLAAGGAVLVLSAVLFFARTKDDGASTPAAARVLEPLVSGIRF